jgi:hypothetical protein
MVAGANKAYARESDGTNDTSLVFMVREWWGTRLTRETGPAKELFVLERKLIRR